MGWILWLVIISNTGQVVHFRKEVVTYRDCMEWGSALSEGINNNPKIPWKVTEGGCISRAQFTNIESNQNILISWIQLVHFALGVNLIPYRVGVDMFTNLFVNGIILVLVMLALVYGLMFVCEFISNLFDTSDFEGY